MSGARPATAYYKTVQVHTTCRRPTTLTLTFLSYRRHPHRSACSPSGHTAE
jgi:hypothetical protein